MGLFKSLSSLEIELNSPHLGDWPLKVGQYMLNFAAIELLSYQYLNALESTREQFVANVDRLLGARIDRIVTLVGASAKLPDDEKQAITSLWLEAKDLSMWRNRIAHNPVLPTWKPGSDAKTQPPDLLGIPDMKQLKRGTISDSLSKEGVNHLIEATADLGYRLSVGVQKL